MSDGSSKSTSYSGPNGTGNPTSMDVENADGSSELTRYGSNGASATSYWSGPKGSGEAGKTVVTLPNLDNGSDQYFTQVITIPSLIFEVPAYRVGGLDVNPFSTLENSASVLDEPDSSENSEYQKLIEVESPSGQDYDAYFNSEGNNINGFSVSSFDSFFGNESGQDERKLPITINALSDAIGIAADVKGNVYQTAVADVEFQSSEQVFHVGDVSSSFSATITNTTSGSLPDSLVIESNGSGQPGTHLDITDPVFSPITLTAGQSATVEFNVDTSTAGADYNVGPTNLDLLSHDDELDNVKAEGVSGSDPFTAVYVNDYAEPEFEDEYGNSLPHSGSVWTLDLGTVERGTTAYYSLPVYFGDSDVPDEYRDNLTGTFDISGYRFDHGIDYSPGQNIQQDAESLVANFVPNSSSLGEHLEIITFHPISVAPQNGEQVTLPDIKLEIIENVVPCYVAGTQIKTSDGWMAVECLTAGDVVVTASGACRSVRWIGHRRLDLRRHPDPLAVQPVRVSAGAFGPSQPLRDLWLSPGHNLFLDGVLMPVCVLINGVTVEQVPVDTVTYWHVELDSHDVILAEGLPAESYLDTGNRTAFKNGGSFLELYPNFEPRHEADTCAPILKAGPEVEAVKARLLTRVAALGHSTTTDPDLHLLADGNRIEPILLGDRRFAFYLPSECKRIALASRSFVPCHGDPASSDSRHLGVAIKTLRLDGIQVELDTLSSDGWHETEVWPGLIQRWTNGTGSLPAEARVVAVDLSGDGRYWVEHNENGVALRA